MQLVCSSAACLQKRRQKVRQMRIGGQVVSEVAQHAVHGLRLVHVFAQRQAPHNGFHHLPHARPAFEEREQENIA